MKIEDYNVHEGVRSSFLIKMMGESPYHAKWHHDNPKEPTPAMALGSFVHDYILQPHLVSQYICWEGGRRQGKAFDAFMAEAEEQGLKVVDAKDLEIAKNASQNLWRDWQFDALASILNIEQSYFAEIDGVLCKARPDMWYPLDDHRVVMIDLKTTDSCLGFEKKVMDLHYYFQACFHIRVFEAVTNLKVAKYQWLVVDKQPPYASVVRNLSTDFREYGMGEVDKALALYKQCVATDTWPSYSMVPEDVEMPMWFKGWKNGQN